MKQSLIILFILFTLNETFGQSDEQLVPYRDGKKWGYANRDGKIIIKPKYDSAGFFGDNYDSLDVAKIKVGGNYRYINRSEETVTGNPKEMPIAIALKFEEEMLRYVSSMRYGFKGVYFCYSKGKFGFVGSDSVCNAVFTDFAFTARGIDVFKDSIGWGVYDSGTQKLLSARYDSIYFSDADIIVVNKNRRYGLINRDGDVIINTKYDLLKMHHGLTALVVKKGEKFGLISLDDRQLLPFEYKNIVGLPHGFNNMFYVQDRKGLYGFVDANGTKFFK